MRELATAGAPGPYTYLRSTLDFVEQTRIDTAERALVAAKAGALGAAEQAVLDLEKQLRQAKKTLLGLQEKLGVKVGADQVASHSHIPQDEPWSQYKLGLGL